MAANMTMNFNDNISLITNSSLTIVSGQPWNLLQKLLLGAWLTISMLCAVFGNLMVILVVLRHKGMQTRTNMFLVNLAVADCFVGTLLAPFSLTTLVMDKWIFGEVMCHINGFMNATCFITSFQTLMYISIHKYVSITRPFSRVLNHWKILIMIGAAWLWAILCAVLTMFILNRVIFKPGAMQCGPEYPQNELEYIHTSVISLSNILVPIGIMTFAYAQMYCEFRQHVVRLRKNTTLQSDQILSQQLQITKTLFIVLACFIMCILPYFSYTVYVSMAKDKTKIPTWANPVVYCFMYMNSGCNPVIYAWRSPSFRQGYKQILCRDNGCDVGDDIIRESESPSIITKLSALLQSSILSSRLAVNRNSDESLSVSPVHMSRNASVSSPSHTLLKWATSKAAKGSSVLRYDGFIVITKNGKIISVLRDKESITKERIFDDFDQMFLHSKLQNGGASRSVSEKDITANKSRVELNLLFKMAKHTRGSSVSCIPCNSIIDNYGNSKSDHKSLTKIDSVSETEIDKNACSIKLHPPAKGQMSRSNTFSCSQGETAALLQQGQEIIGYSPFIKLDLDDAFSTMPFIDSELLEHQSSEEWSSKENKLNSIRLVPVLKSRKTIEKSDMQMDHDKDTHSAVFVSNNENISRKSRLAYKVPYLRGPSIETLGMSVL